MAVADLVHPESLVPVAPSASAGGTLDGLLERAAGYAAQSRAPATLRSYAAGWRHFVAWCDAARVAALPAASSTVAAYLTAHAERLAVPTLRRRLTIIAFCHQAAAHPIPTTAPEVRQVWRGIARTHDRPPRQVEPAVTPTLRAMVATCDDSLLGRRDRALLLVGFAGYGLRRSELVAVTLADVTEVPEGLEIRVRRVRRVRGVPTATEDVVPIPYGRIPTCPVRAWQAWLAAARITDGPAFRAVDRYGNISATPLADKTVARVVKRAAARAGLDPAVFSGHSLRAGLAVTAEALGVARELIMEQGGWRSESTMRSYARRGALWRDVVAAQVGL